MKARKYVAIMVTLVASLLLVACANTAPAATTASVEEEVTAEETSTQNQEKTQSTNLAFSRYYLTMPEIDVRANAETPGKVDTLYVGDEVSITQQKGDWVEFTYTKDGEERQAATWTGAISKGIKIHLREAEYVYRLPNQDKETLGSIVMWREATDPDLIILWQENEDWLYVLSTEDCRAGYMRASANYEFVE